MLEVLVLGVSWVWSGCGFCSWVCPDRGHFQGIESILVAGGGCAFGSSEGRLWPRVG